MTKEEVLQKVNDYCSEKSYTSETLTEDFKDKFAGFFAQRYADKDFSDDLVADLQFNLNTAFSATSKGITEKQKAFEAKENDYKLKIEELEKQKDVKPVEEPSISDEIKKKLAELDAFKNEQRKSEKFKEVLAQAKKSVRSDLHRSLENYATDFNVTLEEDTAEQAKKLTSRFQEIFKDSIGDVKPLAPKQTQKRDEEVLAAIPKVKI